MSIIKSFSVGNGDMFYINHNSDNFTIIDCCYNTKKNKEKNFNEIKEKSFTKGITRFISTHPDEDHIRGLKYLTEIMEIVNFYVVENKAIKCDEETENFKKYCKLRDNKKKVFYIYKNCERYWMNKTNETDFLKKIKDDIDWKKIDILFAPHHGRYSGRIPEEILKKLKPKVIVIGEAPSENLNYYKNYNTITQNSAGDITFECLGLIVNVYVSNEGYNVGFLDDKDKDKKLDLGYYIGSFKVEQGVN